MTMADIMDNLTNKDTVSGQSCILNPVTSFVNSTTRISLISTVEAKVGNDKN